MKFLLSFLFTLSSLLATTHVTNDYSKGVDLAKGHSLPLALVFTGSDGSEPTQSLMKALRDEALASELVIVQVDFPELNRQEEAILSQNHALKEKYNVDHFPTVVLIDREENEMARLGFPLQDVSDYAEHLKQIGRRYFLLQKRFEKAKQEKGKGELKLCYEEATKLGAIHLAHTILEEGYRDVPSLMLEKYATLEASPEKESLKTQLMQINDPDIQSRLTLLAFQEKEDPTLLEEHLAKFSEKTGDHCWKIHRILSDYLTGEEALEHAQVSYRYAPSEEKETIGALIEKLIPTESTDMSEAEEDLTN